MKYINALAIYKKEAIVISIALPFVNSKNFFLFLDANSLERQQSEQANGKRKVAQLKWQQFLSLDSQSIERLI